MAGGTPPSQVAAPLATPPAPPPRSNLAPLSAVSGRLGKGRGRAGAGLGADSSGPTQQPQ